MPTIDRIGRLAGPLAITCGACRRCTVWTPQQATARFGGMCTTVDAKRRLRCGGCGERRSWMIMFAAAPAAVVPTGVVR
jgi:hypothetical protein